VEKRVEPLSNSRVEKRTEAVNRTRVTNRDSKSAIKQ